MSWIEVEELLQLLVKGYSYTSTITACVKIVKKNKQAQVELP